MRFATTKGEKTIRELATRLYAFEGEPSAATLRKAERALMDANPFLRKPADVAEGVVLAVPGLERAEPSEEARSLGSVVGATATGVLEGTLAAAAESFERSLKEEREEVDSSLATLRSRELKKVARADEEADRALRQATDAAKSRVAELDALDRYKSEAFAQLGEDLKALLLALGGEAEGHA
jgi:hypothetical protein